MRAWACAVPVVLAAAAAWAFLPPARGPVRPAGPAPVEPFAPPAPGLEPAPPGGPGLRGEAAGSIEGLVLREARPTPAFVTARFLGPCPGEGEEDGREGDALPGSFLYGGMEAAPRQRTEGDAGGRWAFRGLGAGVFLFEAIAADGARGAATAVVAPEGPLPTGVRAPPRSIRIQLGSGGHAIRGRAVGVDGRPWTGFVGARRDGGEGADPAPVRAAPDGTFRIEGLPRGIVRLHALHPGEWREAGPLVLVPCDEEVPLVLDGRPGELEGRVLDDATGLPVPEVRVSVEVRAWPVGGGFSGLIGESLRAESVLTDGRGTFRVKAPPGGGDPARIEMRFDAPGYCPLFGALDGGEAGLEPLPDFRLQRPGSVAGRVLVEGTGAPAAGLTVESPEPAARGVARAATDAEGRFRIEGLLPGALPLRAFGEGWISKGLAAPAGQGREDSAVVPPGGEAAADLLVVPAPRVRGRVLDASGAGVGGCTVEAERRVSEWSFNHESVSWEPEVVSLPRRPVTGPDGSFRFGALSRTGTVRFVARRGDVPVGVAGPYWLEPGAETAVDLRLPPGRSIEIRVEGEEGGIVPGTRVTVEALLLPAGFLQLGSRLVADAEGMVRLEGVPDVPLDVVAWSPRGVDYAAGVRFQAPPAAGPVVIRLPASTLPSRDAIEGTVALEDGTPVEGAEAAVLLDLEEDIHTARLWDRGSSRSDWRGRFRLEGLPIGERRIRFAAVRDGVRVEGEATARAGARDVRILLRPAPDREATREETRSLQVRVLGPDGDPIPDGRLSWTVTSPEGGFRMSGGETVRDGEGALEIPRDLYPGSVHLRADGARDREGRALPFGPALLGPVPLGDEVLLLRLPRERSIEGMVVGPGGSPLPGARVRASVPDEGDGGGIVARPNLDGADTDAEGRFRIGRLGEGDVLLECSREGFLAARVRARPGTDGLTVPLRRSVDCRIRVLDPGGRPVGWANVEAREGPGAGSPSIARGGTLGTGTCTLYGLDPEARYLLTVEPPEGSKGLAPARIGAWVPADTEVRLAAR